jgi:hypothetical protein
MIKEIAATPGQRSSAETARAEAARALQTALDRRDNGGQSRK